VERYSTEKVLSREGIYVVFDSIMNLEITRVEYDKCYNNQIIAY
jgi:hypothetical protein